MLTLLMMPAASPAGWEGLIAVRSRALFAEAISRAKTVVWNGPLGVFEFDTLPPALAKPWTR